MPGLMEMLAGRPEVTKQFPRFTPEQQGALGQILQKVMPQLMGGQFDFGPIEEQARAGFKERTLPSIASRLTQMGQGARYSSGAADVMGQAGTDLERSLAAMKQQYGMQQQKQIMGLLGAGLTPQFDTQWRPETGGLLGGMAPGFGAGIGQGLGTALGGWMGGAPGQGDELGQQAPQQQGGMPGYLQTGATAFGTGLGGMFGGPVGAAAGGAGASALMNLLYSLMSQKGAGA